MLKGKLEVARFIDVWNETESWSRNPRLLLYHDTYVSDLLSPGSGMPGGVVLGTSRAAPGPRS